MALQKHVRNRKSIVGKASARRSMFGAARLAWILFSIYLPALFALKLYGFPIVPDEVSALDNLNNYSSVVDAYLSYTSAYGGGFWAFLFLAVHMLGPFDAYAIFLALLLAPLFVVWRVTEGRTRIIALLVWICMPMACWRGKVISADSLIVFLTSMAILSAYRKKPFQACLLAGVSIGLKLNAVAMVPPLLLLLGARLAPLRAWHLAYLMLIPLGAALAGMAWLLDYEGCLAILKSVTITAQHPLNSLGIALFNTYATWDLVVSHAPLSSAFAVPGFILILLLAVRTRHLPLICAMLAFVSLASLFLLSQVSTGWYWFPFYAFLFIALFLDVEKLRRSMLYFPALGLLGWSLISYNYFDFDLLLKEAMRNRNVAELLQCLVPVAKSLSPPVYLRSFDSVEKRIAAQSGGTIIAGAFRYQDMESHDDAVATIGDPVLVDTALFDVGFYRRLEHAPTYCGGTFVLLMPARLVPQTIEVPR